MDPTYEAAAQLSGNLLSFAGKAATEVLDAAAASANIPKVGPPTVIVVSTDGSYGPTLQLILQELTKMSAELDTLKAQVAASDQVIASAVTLIQGLADQLTSIANDPAAITQLAADLKSNTDSLAQAVTANTPTPTPPGPVPTPTPTPVPEPAPVDPNAPTA